MTPLDGVRDAIKAKASAARFIVSGGRGLKLTIEPAGAPAKTMVPEPGEYLCANDAQADIVLLGASKGSGFRFVVVADATEVEIAALGSDVSVDGTQVSPGSPQRFKVPFMLKAGSTTVRFGGGVAPAMPIPSNVKIAAVVAAAAAGLATIAPGTLSLPFLSSPPTPIVRPAESRWTTQTDTLAGIKRVLGRYDLTQRVSASEQGKTIMLSGEVGGSEVRRWQDALGIIRAQADTPITVSVRLDPAESMSGRSIAGVAIAPERFIVTRSGQRVRIGETLPEGWMVKDIDSKGVVLERNGFSENISF